MTKPQLSETPRGRRRVVDGEDGDGDGTKRGLRRREEGAGAGEGGLGAH